MKEALEEIERVEDESNAPWDENKTSWPGTYARTILDKLKT